MPEQIVGVGIGIGRRILEEDVHVVIVFFAHRETGQQPIVVVDVDELHLVGLVAVAAAPALHAGFFGLILHKIGGWGGAVVGEHLHPPAHARLMLPGRRRGAAVEHGRGKAAADTGLGVEGDVEGDVGHERAAAVFFGDGDAHFRHGRGVDHLDLAVGSVDHIAQRRTRQRICPLFEQGDVVAVGQFHQIEAVDYPRYPRREQQRRSSQGAARLAGAGVEFYRMLRCVCEVCQPEIEDAFAGLLQLECAKLGKRRNEVKRHLGHILLHLGDGDTVRLQPRRFEHGDVAAVADHRQRTVVVGHFAVFGEHRRRENRRGERLQARGFVDLQGVAGVVRAQVIDANLKRFGFHGKTKDGDRLHLFEDLHHRQQRRAAEGHRLLGRDTWQRRSGTAHLDFEHGHQAHVTIGRRVGAGRGHVGGQRVHIGESGRDAALDLSFAVAGGPIQHTLAETDVIGIRRADLKFHKNRLVRVEVGDLQIERIGGVERCARPQHRVG